jgi:hypothetical protein
MWCRELLFCWRMPSCLLMNSGMPGRYMRLGLSARAHREPCVILERVHGMMSPQCVWEGKLSTSTMLFAEWRCSSRGIEVIDRFDGLAGDGTRL